MIAFCRRSNGLRSGSVEAATWAFSDSSRRNSTSVGGHTSETKRERENWFFYFRSLSSHKTFIFRHKIVSDEIKATDGKKTRCPTVARATV